MRERGLLDLLPRVRERATCRGFLVQAEQLVELLADPRLVLGAVPEPWPFPPRTRVVPALVAARDLSESTTAEQLVGLLFVAAEPLKRSGITQALRISPARLARACTVLQMDPPRGLRLLDSGEQLTLVSAPACRPASSATWARDRPKLCLRRR